MSFIDDQTILIHTMMTSSNGNIFHVTGLCERNPQFTGGFPSQMLVPHSFDEFVDLRLKNVWANNRDAGDLRRHRVNYDVTVM